MPSSSTFDIVVATAGSPSLDRLLYALADAYGPRPGRVIVVDDRAHDGAVPIERSIPGSSLRTVWLRTLGHGPAAARNCGWRKSEAEWVVFLDDDVVPPPEWLSAVARDLAGAGDDVAVSRSRGDALAADVAYRRRALIGVGGFDERLRDAFHECADVDLQLTRAGYRVVDGVRAVARPDATAGPWGILREQAQHADDALMRARYGARWRRAVGLARDRVAGHARTVGFRLAALVTLPVALVRRVLGELRVRRDARLGVPVTRRIGVGPLSPKVGVQVERGGTTARRVRSLA